MGRTNTHFTLPQGASEEQFPNANRPSDIWIVVLLLVLLSPSTDLATAAVPFSYTINNSKVTITKYVGPLGAVTIPGSINGFPVTTIAGGAFTPDRYGYGQATSVEIPSTVTSISSIAFESGILTGITVSESNPYYGSLDGVLFNKDLSTLLRYPAARSGNDYTFPDSVTSIGWYAFSSCTNLTSIDIPDSVTNIGGAVFKYSSSLRNVTIGNGVPTIGNQEFYQCSSLTNVTIGSTVTSIGDQAFTPCYSLRTIAVHTNNPAFTSLDGVLFNKSTNTLIQCPGGTVGDYTVPGSVTTIGDIAFYCCASLTTVTIPNTVTSIQNWAFKDCTSLAGVAFGNGLTNIGNSAFEGCTSLTNATIPDGVTSIPSSAFLACTSLTSAAVGNGVISIGSQAFDSCTSLRSVTLGSIVTAIGDFAFRGCTSLPSLAIPNSVTSIGHGAFYACTGLTTLTISSSVTNVGTSAFRSCSSLASLAISNGITSIGIDAFSECTSLTSVTIPDSVVSIGGQAFGTCTSLTNAIIGSGLTSIESGAFSYCISLTSLYFKGNAPNLEASVFDGTTNATAYYLPGTTGWGPTFGSLPTALWLLPNPLILNNSPSFDGETNQFGFLISWATNIPVVVESCTNLANPIWSPVATNTLSAGTSYFSDPEWTNYPGRFYRLRSP